MTLSAEAPLRAADSEHYTGALDAPAVRVIHVDMGRNARDLVELAGLHLMPLYTPDECRSGKCSAGASCKKPGKHPRLWDWEARASADLAQIEAWWKRWPLANIGLPAGRNDLLGIDVDDPARFEALVREFGPPPATIEQLSGRGNGASHLIFACEEPLRSGNPFGPGIDVKCHGGQLVLAPSLHESGRRYTAHSERTFGRFEPARISDWRGYERMRAALLPHSGGSARRK
jgi:putative DNA primase/helicase